MPQHNLLVAEIAQSEFQHTMQWHLACSARRVDMDFCCEQLWVALTPPEISILWGITICKKLWKLCRYQSFVSKGFSFAKVSLFVYKLVCLETLQVGNAMFCDNYKDFVFAEKWITLLQLYAPVNTLDHQKVLKVCFWREHQQRDYSQGYSGLST